MMHAACNAFMCHLIIDVFAQLIHNFTIAVFSWQVVAEVVRLVLQAISLAGSQSLECEQDLMAVLLSVLIQDIAPRLSEAPALRELALKLVTQIASGSMSAAFKSVAAKLSPQHKQRLQVWVYLHSIVLTKFVVCFQ